MLHGTRDKLRSAWQTIALCGGLFLVILGTKLVVIDRYGSDMPNWDQWDAEAELLLLPYYQDRLSFLDLFKPHNEHRVAISKALSLGVVLLNGQWDARLQCVVNAILHSGVALAAFVYLRRLMPPLGQIALLGIVAILFGAPIAWANVLAAFHSAQVFLVGFSLAAIAIFAGARPFSRLWFAGVACTIGALFSMASGLFAPPAVLAMLVVAHGISSLWKRHLATAIVCVAAIVAGWLLRVNVPYHEPLKAHSFREFFWTVWHNLQWPVASITAFAVLSFVPWALLGWRAWRRRETTDTREAVIFGAGIWVLLQYLATGYARGAGGDWPAERYLDTVAVAMLVNVAAMMVLVTREQVGRVLGGVRLAIFAAWTLLIAHGLFVHLRSVFAHRLPEVKEYHVKAERVMRAYLATGDDHFLDDPNRPYPGKETLMDRLAHPEIRAILPVSIRPPLKMEGATSPPDAFVTPPADYKFAQPWNTWRSGAPLERPKTGTWQSKPLPKGSFPIWRIDVTGHPREADVSLQITTADTSRVITKVVPRRDAHDAWRPAFVCAPPEGSVLVARDSSADHWVGFSEPAEMATLSYLALALAKQGLTLAIMGGICSGAGVAGIATKNARIR